MFGKDSDEGEDDFTYGGEQQTKQVLGFYTRQE